MMNSVQLIGNVGADPQYRQFPSGKRVGRFSIALNNYSGKKTDPTWVNCELWDAAVERLQKCSVKSGTRLAVSGSLAQSSYDRTVGNTTIKERKLYVKVASFQVLSSKGEVLASESADPDPAADLHGPVNTYCDETEMIVAETSTVIPIRKTAPSLRD